MEFLNFVLILVATWILLRKPEKEPLAFKLLVVSFMLMVSLFLIGTRTSILPGLNY
jgi:heme A synthase